MLNHKIKILLIITIFVFSGCTVDKASQQSVDLNSEGGSVDKSKAVITDVSGKISIYDGEASTTEDFAITEGASVFDLMKKMQSEGRLVMQYKDSNLGVFVESINSIENNSQTNQYWMLYINGELANVGVSDHIIADNDLIEWRYVDTSNMSF